ncbi:MAG TPA: cellulase family glycosylhydrolase [Candidatus Atribacteria bacterium]|nr:cellulase family glycosylhydrolase [Candidatus Atribacteria bacterium]
MSLMLHTEGNTVKNEKGETVRLLGVNRAGLEWASKDDRIVDSVVYACDVWHANLIRLPLSQDRWFGRGPEQRETDPDGNCYRSLVAQVVDEIQKRGKYVILDLHWSNCNVWGENIGQHSMPDYKSLEFWTDVSKAYKNHPSVLFGLYNEPRDVSWEVWRNGGTVQERYRDREGNVKHLEYEAPGLQTIAYVIRDSGAVNILVIGGLEWAYTLTGIAEGYGIDDNRGNGIIYDTHVYPWKYEWDKNVTVIADKYPILVGECGHYGNLAKPREGAQSDPCEVWVPRLLSWIDRHNYHMSAWDFHPSAGPCLIKNFDNEPTEYWGSYVKEYLQDKHNKGEI